MFNGFELPDQRLKSFHARALAFETLWSISGSGRSPRCGLMPKCRHHVCCRKAALAGESASWAFEPCNRNWLCRNRRTRATRPLAGIGDASANTHIFKCGKREESALPSLPRNSKKAVSPSFLTAFVQDRHEAPGRSNVDLSAGDPPPFFAIAPHSPGPRRTGRRAGGPALCSRLERKGKVPIEGEVS